MRLIEIHDASVGRTHPTSTTLFDGDILWSV